MKGNYFSHDYSARNDERVLELRSEFGWEGYGLFFGIVEMMAENKGQLNRTKTGAIAIGLSTDRKLVESIIDKCLELGLFYDAGDLGVLRSKRLDEHFEIRGKYAEAGRKGGSWTPSKQSETDEKQATVKPGLNKAEAIKKESKVKKESKETKKNVYVVAKPPTAQQVDAYFLDNGSELIEAAKFRDHFVSNGWKVGGRSPMKDWKASARNWMRNVKHYDNGKRTDKDKSKQRFDRIASAGG